MKKTVAAIIGFSILLAACTSTKTESSDSIAQTRVLPGVEKEWMITGFSEPESVLSLPDHPWLYVSNVNGEETGFISRIAKDGAVDTLRWIDGIQTPTGMGYRDGHIYAANQSEVVVINVSEGKIVNRLPSEAESLNDVSVSEDGEIFVSDLDSNSIYTVLDNEVVLWMEVPGINLPNGVLADGDSLYVLSTALLDFRQEKLTPGGFGSVYRIDVQSREISLVEPTKKIGALDGIIAVNEGYIISDPLSGNLFFINNDESVLLTSEPGGAADIGVDADDNSVIYVPLLFAGKIASFRMIEEEWQRVLTEDMFRNTIADNYFGDAAGKSVAAGDGTISGNFGGQELKGTWEWSGEYLSRTSTLGDLDLGHDNIVIEISGSKMKLTLKKGTGPSVIYEKREAPAELSHEEVLANRVKTELGRGFVETYNFDSIKLHAYYTRDLMNDLVLIIEKNGKALILESPAFLDNFDELRTYMTESGISAEAIIPSYHPLGESFIDYDAFTGMDVYLTRQTLDYWETGYGAVMKQGIPEVFGDSVDSTFYNHTVLLEEGETEIAGIKLIVSNSYDGFDIEIPELNAAYLHILGHDVHSEILSLEHLDIMINALKEYTEKGYDLFLSCHYGPETGRDAAEKLAYLKHMKIIASEAETGEDFMAAMREAYPGYQDGYLMPTTASLYKDFSMPMGPPPEG